MRRVDDAVSLAGVVEISAGCNDDGALVFGALEGFVKVVAQGSGLRGAAKSAGNAGDHGDVDHVRAVVEGAVDGGGEGFQSASAFSAFVVGAGLADAEDGGLGGDTEIIVVPGSGCDDSGDDGAVTVAVVQGVVTDQIVPGLESRLEPGVWGNAGVDDRDDDASAGGNGVGWP